MNSSTVLKGSIISVAVVAAVLAFGITAFAASVAPTTDPATNITVSDATLNGTVGSSDVDNTGFWAATSTFSTADPSTMPPGVYSTGALAGATAGSSFSAQLSSITGLLPITSDTTYYFTAWTAIGSTWTPGGQLSFTTLSAPTITNISPASGSTAGGTSVTITGTEFNSGATVTIGGNAATNVVVVNSTTTTATTPAGTAGAQDVVVTNTDGGTVTSTGGFTYTAPAPSTVYVDASGGSDSNNGSQGSPFATIQKGVDTVASGGTVNVAAGTYNENVIISKSLTLAGPNADIDPNTGTRGTEAVINGASGIGIQPKATDITINGFTISSTANDAIYDIGPVANGGVTDASGLTISDNIVTTTGSGRRAIALESDGSNFSILHNKVTGTAHALAGADGTWSNMKIDNNYFAKPTDAGDTDAIQMGPDGTGPVNGFEFKDNTVLGSVNIGSNIDNGTVSGNTFDYNSAGDLEMQIVLHDSTVSGNTFNGHGTTGCFQLFGSQYGLVASASTTISDNSFNDCGAGSPSTTFGVQLSQDVQHVFVTGNTFTDSYDAINTRTGSGWDLSANDIHVNNNTITGSRDLGVNNTVTGTLDATQNWFGEASGPHNATSNPGGTGDGVSDNVSFSPWWANSNMTTLQYATSTSGSNTTATTGNATTTETADTSSGTTTLQIAPNTTITGDASWDGTIQALTATTTNVTVTADSGDTATVVEAVEIGNPNQSLTLDPAARIEFAGQAGKLVGWTINGNFTPITATCSDDTQASNDANLAARGDCKISDDGGGNLIVWTKHFTTFEVYTETAVSSGGGGGGSSPVPSSGPIVGGGGGGGGGVAVALPFNGGAPGGSTGSTGTGTGTGTGQVLGASTYNFTTNLTIGSTGPDVVALQQILIAQGYSIPALTSGGAAYGYFGAQTRAAVAAYQAAHGITPAVGFFGPITRASFNLGVTPTSLQEQKALLLQQLESQLAILEAELAASQAAH